MVQGVGHVMYTNKFTYGDGRTSRKWIACVISGTNADSIMVYHSTISIVATSARARINAFLIDARFLQWTIGHTDTFGTTRWRTTIIARQTWTNRLILMRRTLTVGTARRRYTCIFVAGRYSFFDGYTGNMRISSITWRTATYCNVI